MPAESRATTPAALQQLSDDVIRLYRGTAAFAKRACAGDYAGSVEEAQQEIDRLVDLAHKVLLRRNEFFLFRRAQVQHPQEGWRATCRASWHDQAALEVGEVLWDFVGPDAGRFPPEPGDPPPPHIDLGVELKDFDIGRPDCQWQGYHTWSDEGDGWEARMMETTLQTEAARAAQICAAGAAPMKEANQNEGAIEPGVEANGDPDEEAKPVRKRKSTESGEARRNWIGGLTLHHKYDNGHCGNLDPIGANELARNAGISLSQSSNLFNEVFGGHGQYRRYCREQASLDRKMRTLNDETIPHELFNPLPDDAGATHDAEPDDD